MPRRVAFVRGDGRVDNVIILPDNGPPNGFPTPPGHTRVELSADQFCEPGALYDGNVFTRSSEPQAETQLDRIERLIAQHTVDIAELKARPGNGGGGPPNQPNSQQPK